jgi:hypothetical protein
MRKADIFIYHYPSTHRMRQRILATAALFVVSATGGLLATATQTQAGTKSSSSFLHSAYVPPGDWQAAQMRIKEAGDPATPPHPRDMVEHMKTSFEAQLERAIQEGRVKEGDKDLLLQQMEEERQWFLELIELTPQQRGEQMKEHQQRRKEWADSNGIDPRLLRPKEFHHDQFARRFAG